MVVQRNIHPLSSFPITLTKQVLAWLHLLHYMIGLADYQLVGLRELTLLWLVLSMFINVGNCALDEAEDEGF